jgi:squalene-associated FAD-dependent desaturase
MTGAHVIGAGLAGLSAAIALTEAGFTVALSEAAPRAGGRCRSYRDALLGMTIDNGNHLLLTGNAAAAQFLTTTGGDAALGQPEACFAFTDLRDGVRWWLRPNPGPVPWWILSAKRRVPGTSALDYLTLGALLHARSGARVGDVLPRRDALWRRLIEPFLLASLNTPLATASASLAAAVVRRTLMRGGQHYRARFASPSLAAAFVDPALAWLRRHGATIHMNRQLRRLEFTERHVSRLHFREQAAAVADAEPVVLAVPSWAASTLVPGLIAPQVHHAIVNAHFAIAAPAVAPPMLGVVGGIAQWIFAHADRIAVTVSAADALVGGDRAQLAALLWQDVTRAYAVDWPIPPWRIVVEKRATFAATPEQDARRPVAATSWSNFVLAGDWAQTGLPATIEGAIQSGRTAVHQVMSTLRRL